MSCESIPANLAALGRGYCSVRPWWAVSEQRSWLAERGKKVSKEILGLLILNLSP